MFAYNSFHVHGYEFPVDNSIILAICIAIIVIESFNI